MPNSRSPLQKQQSRRIQPEGFRRAYRLPAAAFFAGGVCSLSAASFASRSARNRSVRSRTARPLARYSSMAWAPSRARSSFLKFASARARAPFDRASSVRLGKGGLLPAQSRPRPRNTFGPPARGNRGHIGIEREECKACQRARPPTPSSTPGPLKDARVRLSQCNWLDMELKVLFSFEPRLETTPMTASEMPAAIRPYSMPVAPDLIFQELQQVLFTITSPGPLDRSGSASSLPAIGIPSASIADYICGLESNSGGSGLSRR